MGVKAVKGGAYFNKSLIIKKYNFLNRSVTFHSMCVGFRLILKDDE